MTGARKAGLVLSPTDRLWVRQAVVSLRGGQEWPRAPPPPARRSPALAIIAALDGDSSHCSYYGMRDPFLESAVVVLLTLWPGLDNPTQRLTIHL